jgi:hypothetical protein
MHFPSIPQVIRDYQELIAGTLAVLAAIITARAVWRAAQVPIVRDEQREAELKRRQLVYTCSILSSELKTLSVRALQADSTIVTVAAANSQINEDTKKKCSFNRPKILDDWTAMSLLPPATMSPLMTLYKMVDDHNFDVARSGGAFGADSFRQTLRKRLTDIQTRVTGLCSQIDPMIHTLSSTQ